MLIKKNLARTAKAAVLLLVAFAFFGFSKNTQAATFLNDTFTDTAGTSITSHIGEVGATWTRDSTTATGTAAIDSAGRLRSTYTTDSAFYASGNPQTADYSIEWDIHINSIPVGTRIISPLARMAPGQGKYYALWFEKSGKWTLYRYTSQFAGTAIGSWTGSAAQGETYHAKLTLIGSSITFSVDGVQRISVTDPVITAPGKVGILLYGTDADNSGLALDNITAKDEIPLATSYTFTGPTGGTLNATSSIFSITPNGAFTGTITPQSTGSGTFLPTSLTWNDTSEAKTFTYTPTSTSSSPHVISVTSSPAITNPASINYGIIGPLTTLSIDNPNLYWSRDNVYKNGSSSALMLTPGSYLKTNFTGTSIALSVDTSAAVTANVAAINYPIVRYQIDGGSWTSTQLSSTTSRVSIAGLTPSSHTLRFEYEAGHSPATSGTDKWNTPVNAVKVTGILIDEGSNLSSPTILPNRLRVDGDSITEGLRDINTSDTPAGGTAPYTYGYLLSQALGTELTMLGYGGQGWFNTGTGNIPPYPTAVLNYYNGVSRLISGVLPEAPQYWLINQGTNDGSDVTTVARTRLASARAEAGTSTHIFLMVPFNGSHRAQLTSAYNAYVASSTTDTRVHLLDLGSISYATTDGLHPSAAGHQTLANAILPLITSAIADVTPPVITSITSSTTDTSATITWITNELASSQINYGTSSAYTASTTLNTASTTSHSVTIGNLLPSTLYHYRIRSVDTSNNLATSTDYTFTTSATTVVTQTENVSSGPTAGGYSNPSSILITTSNPHPSNDCLPGHLYSVITGMKCTSPKSFFTFTRNLTINTTGEDVRQLQVYLNTHGFPVSNTGVGSLGNESTFFGQLTKSALAKFQAANGINPAAGYFGVITRGFIGK